MDGNFLVIQRVFDRLRRLLVNFDGFTHRDLADSHSVGQFPAGANLRERFGQRCHNRSSGFIASGRRTVGFRFGFDSRLEFQGDFGKLPCVQIAAAFLGIDRPLHSFQRVVKVKHRHLIGYAELVAYGAAVVSVHYHEVFVDDNGRIATVGLNVLFQNAQLLVRKRREQVCEFRQYDGRLFHARIDDSGIFHQAASSPTIPPNIAATASPIVLRGVRNSTADALIRNPG